MLKWSALTIASLRTLLSPHSRLGGSWCSDWILFGDLRLYLTVRSHVNEVLMVVSS